MTWLPIATAPRPNIDADEDRVEIDLWVVERRPSGRCDEFRAPAAYWGRVDGRGCWCSSEHSKIEVLVMGGDRIVTHWMPMPKGPDHE